MNKPHYVAMDAVRGLAAISVVLFHINQWMKVPWLASHAGLAVDLFFCLSGFVVPLAYDNRMRQGLTFWSFAAVRLIRLVPLIALAALISALYVFFRIKAQHLVTEPWELPLAFILGLLSLPYFGASKAMGGPELYPLNGPQYTLFLELFVNGLWASSRILRQPRAAMAIVIISAALVALYGLGGDKPETFWIGFPRVCFSFFLGTLVFSFQERLRSFTGRRDVFWFLLTLTMLLFYYPRNVPWPLVFAWIALLAPLLVSAAAYVVIAPRAMRPLLLAGRLSYPIYALHYPIFCWINGVFQEVAHRRVPAVEGPLILGSVVCGSWLLLRFYDEPVRVYLSAVMRRRRSLAQI